MPSRFRAIVETARFTDPRSSAFIVKTLAERRDKIGRTFFSKVLPLDNFSVENEELIFDDLAERYGFQTRQSYEVRWFSFDNIQQKNTLVSGSGANHLPREALQAVAGSYFSAVINRSGGARKTVSVYLRKEDNGFKVVGTDRNW